MVIVVEGLFELLVTEKADVTANNTTPTTIERNILKSTWITNGSGCCSYELKLLNRKIAPPITRAEQIQAKSQKNGSKNRINDFRTYDFRSFSKYGGYRWLVDDDNFYKLQLIKIQNWSNKLLCIEGIRLI
jgi:hypothetical protein